ncbi:MAG TPA: FliM/FliN family flagellar motor C-terminal domain-containing protein [Acidobacteriaceae bacterium]|jgi:flagellar motor switch protein FliN/FliY|nr:FliM/FliN family flagellar motor C-terminal domain-containing protein [Acidobacteriaceae bacterium]
MQNLMQRWIGQFEKLLEERSGAALTVTPEVTEPRPAALFLSTLTVEGLTRSLLRVAVPDEEMVQFVQLAEGKPLDSLVVLDETILAAWQSLLEESAARLSRQLLADGDGEYVVTMREMRAAGQEDPVSIAEAASGTEETSYVLRAGEIALRIRILTREEPTLESLDASQNPDQKAQSQQQSNQQRNEEIEEQMREALASAEKEATDRAATATEARAAWRRTESGLEESSPFRTHPERLDLLLDIELEATLRFGAVEMPLRKVLELGPGDVLALDRHVQEPVDLVVGDRIVARGEVVLVGGNFGLHVTEVAEPRRRLETIRCLF